MAVDVTISKAYLKDVDDSNHKVPHYMAVSEVIGAGGKVAVAHFRFVVVVRNKERVVFRWFAN